MLIEDIHRRPYHEQMVEKAVDELKKGAASSTDIITAMVMDWLSSPKRDTMIQGYEYYRNRSDIQKKKRRMSWQSNSKVEHAFVKMLVNQKVGYLLSNRPSVSSDDTAYETMLNEDVFDRGMMKRLKDIGKEAVNKGIAYVYPYIKEDGDLSFRLFRSEEIIPIWNDPEHQEVRSFLRVFDVEYFSKQRRVVKTHVDHYHPEGISHYVFEGTAAQLKGGNNNLIPDVGNNEGETDYHYVLDGKKFLWSKLPIIHFKYNSDEAPLLESVKDLVDNYNNVASTSADTIADLLNYIYILKNYEGEDLEEFMQKLAKYRAVKVDKEGGLDKLQSDPVSGESDIELNRTRADIFDIGRGVDTRESAKADASGKAMRFRYSNLDMDCDELESEMQSSLEHMLYFVKAWLLMTNKGNFEQADAEIQFNRNVIVAETELIENCTASVGILDDQTIRERHPWYTPEVEKRLAEQKAAEQADYEEMVNQSASTDPETTVPQPKV